jgi:hypothetical protein
MRTLLLVLGSLLVAIVHAAEPGTPASLESWRAWVLKDQEFRACPLIVKGSNESSPGSVSAATQSDFICQWPGTLNIAADAKGASITQRWLLEADGWVPLPGSREHWPQQVLVDGQAAAVIDSEGPKLWLAKGNHELRARFVWNNRPQSLRVPTSIGLIALTVDGKPIVPLQREGADGVDLTLGRGAAAAVEADSVELHVYRKFSDNVPGRLTTEIRIDASGQPREEVFGPVLPTGFVPLALDDQAWGGQSWPSRLDDEGRLHVQVQPGSARLTLTARALAPISTLTASLPEHWVRQEVWSFESLPSIRVTSISGAVQVDPRQADVPNGWESLPTYALADGDTLKIEERSRGINAAEANRLSLQREAWLDFSGDGWFAQDHISGQMKSGWRFDLAAPYSLQRAQGKTEFGDNGGLLITRGIRDGLSGVEWHAPNVDLHAGVRIDRGGGAMLVSGWQQVFDQIGTTLHLPYGYRLIAAPGTDRANGSWISGWTLLDVFLAAILMLLAARLFGWVGGALAAAYLLLGYQESGAPIWTLLAVLALALIVRALPPGRLMRFAQGLRVLAVAALLVVALPFCAGQLRQALYPQLEQSQGGFTDRLGSPSGSSMQAESVQGGAMRDMPAEGSPAPMALPASPPAPLEEMKARSNAPISERLDTRVVTGSNVRPAELISKYSQSTVVQTGAGEPGWQLGNRYTLNWSGPVLPEQTVNLIIASPWLVRLLRVLLVGLLVALLWRVARSTPWRWQPAATGAMASIAIICASLLSLPVAHAADYPSDALLQQYQARLLESPSCIPNCASIALAEVSARGDELRVDIEIHALARVAVPVPLDEKALVLRRITIDGQVSDAMARSFNSRIAVNRGVHRVELVYAVADDRVALSFAMLPARVVFSGDEWQASGLTDDRLMTETLSLLRLRTGAGQPAKATAQHFPPYVSLRRFLFLDLNWRIENRVDRMAPREGGFTTSLPLLSGEHVTTPGLKVSDGMVAVALADKEGQLKWDSTLDQTQTITLKAPDLADHAESWVIMVSPTWHVEFSGVPEFVQQNNSYPDDYYAFQFYALPGETLTLRVTRPEPVAGATRAVDRLWLSSDFGLRAQTHTLQFDLRASQGGEQSIRLPATAELLGVTRNATSLGVRPIDGKLSVPVSPGTQQYEVRFRENAPVGFSLSTPLVDLGLPAANISLVATLPNDRWLLAAFGPPVGPAVLFWGELLVAIVLAWLLARWRSGTLRFHHWLLLVLGFSTFSWLALLVVVAWLFALDWRARNAPATNWKFNLLQLGLAALSVVALVCLFESIRNGLLGSPDMVVRGNGSYGNQLQWFADRSVDALPTASVISLPLWAYNVVMLFWALWLAWAVVGWLRSGFGAWTSGGYWRPWRVAPAEPAIDLPPTPPPAA